MALPSNPVRMLVASCAIAAAIATTTACGDDTAQTSGGDETSQTEAGEKATTASSPDANSAESTTDEGQIRALVARIQEAFKTGDGKVVCDSLTEAGQRDLAKYGRTMSVPGPCANVAASITAQNRASKIPQPPVRVVTVRVNGSTATALMKIDGTAPLRQQYDKIDGEWKVRTFGIGAAVDGQDAL